MTPAPSDDAPEPMSDTPEKAQAGSEVQPHDSDEVAEAAEDAETLADHNEQTAGPQGAHVRDGVADDTSTDGVGTGTDDASSEDSSEDDGSDHGSAG